MVGRKKHQNQLNPKQQRFVSEYLKTGNGAQSAIAAGYSAKSAKDCAHRLLTQSPAVKSALSRARLELQEVTQYNAEAAMQEAKEAMEFARETGNANAFVKGAELRAKLNGLLIEKHHVRQVGDFQINISGFTHPTIEIGDTDEES